MMKTLILVSIISARISKEVFSYLALIIETVGSEFVCQNKNCFNENLSR